MAKRYLGKEGATREEILEILGLRTAYIFGGLSDGDTPRDTLKDAKSVSLNHNDGGLWIMLLTKKMDGGDSSFGYDRKFFHKLENGHLYFQFGISSEQNMTQQQAADAVLEHFKRLTLDTQVPEAEFEGGVMRPGI
jgi:hypothetical protein